MLPRAFRADRKLLELVFSKEGRARYPSRRAAHRLLQLTVIKYPSHPKTAFIISSSVVKHAVDRNRIKRRARAVVSKLRKALPPEHLFLFQFNKYATAASFLEIESAILHLLRPYLLPLTS
ncbi:MAG: hypothetical protein A2542_00850 [Parcubacteria group bacterium RIFOXYD2_FULL_52_8]|nr:MAG: hypothetical protein A2542_00850 [Parcubacteria group bacterium RIFOXYD2_FULL_52_8]